MSLRSLLLGFLSIGVLMFSPRLGADQPSPISSPTSPTPAPTPTTSAAMALLMAGNAKGAVELLEQLVQLNPEKPENWRLLGQACLRAKEVDRALTAFQKLADLQPQRVPFLKLAAAYSLKHEKEKALFWLEKAKASRRANMSEIEHEPAFDELRDQPRFKALMPVAADFSDPLVERLNIIQEWDGEHANDQFGWIARPIGDVNGDGVTDFVTSAPTSGAGGQNAGRVYVYSTKDGNLLWKVDGKPADMLGSGVEAAGDTNRDGIGDVVAGAPNGNKAFIYSGKDGRLLHEFSGEQKGENFGYHVAGVGDVDHDGFADVIVGAPNNSAAGQDAGRAYIYSGHDGHLISTLTGESPGDQFGSAVSGASTGSGSLIVVGAPGAGPNRHGRVYVYQGMSTTPQFTINADDTGAALGAMFVSVVGDIDKDGRPDVYASDWSNAARGYSTGRIYVHSGKDGHRLLTLTGETPGEGFGTNPGKAGDVDGDGFDDILVGSWQYSEIADSAGRVCLYSGKTGKLLQTYTCRTPGDTFGFDAVGIGDVDGDGTTDLLITAGWSGVHGYHSGRIFLISSGVPRHR